MKKRVWDKWEKKMNKVGKWDEKVIRVIKGFCWG